jgi:hypothetical protein
MIIFPQAGQYYRLYPVKYSVIAQIISKAVSGSPKLAGVEPERAEQERAGDPLAEPLVRLSQVTKLEAKSAALRN